MKQDLVVHQTLLERRGRESFMPSGERGGNITVLCCVNAEARMLPPLAIFKGKRINQALMNSAPKNTLCACSKSSLMENCFECGSIRFF